MKKNFIYALMSAIALTGAVGLSSCTDEEMAEVNPNYDPETNSVVVDVALNISTANTASTRQYSSVVQANDPGNVNANNDAISDPFRGISNAKLFTFAVTEGNGKSISSPIAIDKKFDLSQVVQQGEITQNNSRRVLEMSLPLKTNAMIFYGKASQNRTIDLSGTDGYTLEDYYGSFDSNQQNVDAENLSNITFSVSKRLTDANKPNFTKIQKLIAGELSCILNTDFRKVSQGFEATGVPSSSLITTNVTTTYNYSVSLKELKYTGEDGCRTTTLGWKDYGDALKATTPKKYSPFTSSEEMDPLETRLGLAYNQMTTIEGDNGELRAASGGALLRTVQDLWSEVNAVRCASPLSKEEAVAKYLAQQIFDELYTYFPATTIPDGGESGTLVSNVSFKPLASAIPSFETDSFWPVDEETYSSFKRSSWSLSDLTSSSAMTEDMKNLSKFPESFGLPEGATHVKFGYTENNVTHKIFYYPEKFNTSGVNNVDFTVDDYLYPAELTYFGNSPLRVSSTEHTVAQYPNGANAETNGWNNESSWTGWVSGNEAEVNSSTRSVAMRNDINYGTALLKSTVKYADGVTKLLDNNHVIQGRLNGIPASDPYYTAPTGGAINYTEEPDKEIELTATSFQLTGVLIGGQNKNVGWNFLPKKVGTTPAYQYGFVHDRAIEDRSIPVSGTSKPNYTLCFDNFNAEEYAKDNHGQQDKVYIALEFKNNTGVDFYGNYNLIRNGGTFYLIGQLDPNATTNAPTSVVWNSGYHALPPYDENGATIQVPRVFIQDYMTTANFVIGLNSLKFAYLTVPDLRASSLTLGLSVDIKWETGLNFNDIVLGGNDY